MLGVLASTRRVIDAARDVRIDQQAVERLATRLADRGVEAPEWRVWPHWWPDQEDSTLAADYILVLDALNFCFWGEPRWRVEYEGQLLDGYWALAACLRRALENGIPLLDPAYLAAFDEPAARDLFAGQHEIPLLAERIANLREVGRGLQAVGGSFSRLIEAAGGSSAATVEAASDSTVGAGGSGERLVQAVIRHFPSFDDTATYDGQPVAFHKRAQILISDLHGIYHGQGLGAFTDLDRLTAFADYKIPQVLREAGILVYSSPLAKTVDARELIPPGDPREVEIRASTIWGCELLRQALESCRAGLPLRAFEVDWLLWSDAQGRTIEQPYHRTRTIFY